MKRTFLLNAHLVGLILGFVSCVDLKHLVKRQLNLYERRWRKEDFPSTGSTGPCGSPDYLCDPAQILQMSFAEGKVLLLVLLSVNKTKSSSHFTLF